MSGIPINVTRLLVDEGGYCVISDDTTLVYGDGETLGDALRDYRLSLDEWREMVAEDETTTGGDAA